jgi:asparagine synthase (glutamine-hydrolysing)
MRRLSIIDIVGGHQPMESPDGRHAIVFNGEIYNHLDLRRELEAAGTVFRTNSDTETLLHSFIRWGDAAWLRLEGMYAAAIWDRSTRILLLGRDPLGIKPLYLTQQRGGVAFASEISPLRVLPGHTFPVAERGARDFFTFGHIQQPGSIYRTVHSLEPGHVLRVAPTGEPRSEAFWRPRFRTGPRMSEAGWIEETRRRVLASVGQHMLADVPIGSFLSGGVDSGAVTAAMARSTSRRLKAFTVGFPNSPIDETDAARRIADHLGCEHIVLPLPALDAAEVLPAVQHAFDEPTAANSSVPLWALSRLASEHVKAVLCGEGGDELFLGYKRQLNAARIRRWRPLLRAGLAAAGVLDAWSGASSRRFNYLRQNLARLREAASLDTGSKQFFAATQMTSPAVRARLFERGFWERQEAPEALDRLQAEHFDRQELDRLSDLQQFQLGDLAVHMPGSLLYRLDRASMAHSLEARTPFLTHTFVDWALSMPSNLKIRGRVGKYALRCAVQPWLPPGAVARKKLGFQLPLADWFTGEFSDFGRETWRASGAVAAGYLDPGAVEAIFDEHRRGDRDHGRILYAITMFSCWWLQRNRGEAALQPVRNCLPAPSMALAGPA